MSNTQAEVPPSATASGTPRTDAKAAAIKGYRYKTDAILEMTAFAGQLERELVGMAYELETLKLLLPDIIRKSSWQNQKLRESAAALVKTILEAHP